MGNCTNSSAIPVDQDTEALPVKNPRKGKHSSHGSKSSPPTNSSTTATNTAENTGTSSSSSSSSSSTGGSPVSLTEKTQAANIAQNKTKLDMPADDNAAASPLKKKQRWREMDDELTLVDALKLGPPPIREQINEVVELLEELLSDQEQEKLNVKKLRARLNESIYILKNLKIPAEGIEDRAMRLAQQISNSKTINNEVARDTEVQAWMRSNFGTHGRKSGDKDKPPTSAVSRSVSLSQYPSSADSIASKFIDDVRLRARTRRVLMLAGRVRASGAFGKGGESPPPEEKRYSPRLQNDLERIEFNLIGFTTKVVLRKSESWTFDIFRLNECTNQHPLTVLMTHLFERLDLFQHFLINKLTFARFFTAIEDGYNDIPYHNRVHAADVVQNTYHFITREAIKAKLTKADMVAALVGAAIHDYGHPGTNNNFQVQSNSDLALEYNDQSVLENMHCARAFQLLRKDQYNIFASFPQKTRQEIRSAIIYMVLSTDMKYHFEMLAALQQRLADEEKKKNSASEPSSPTTPEEKKETKEDEKDKVEKAKKTYFDPPTPEDRLLLLKVCLHCADLGNPAKPHDIMVRWTAAITEEFFRQGDSETTLGLTLSPMMDRTKPNIEKSQVGFIDVIVFPLFRVFQTLLPEIQYCLDQLSKNKEFWLSQLKTKEPQTPKTPHMSLFRPTQAFPLTSPDKTSEKKSEATTTTTTEAHGGAATATATPATTTPATTTPATTTPATTATATAGATDGKTENKILDVVLDGSGGIRPASSSSSSAILTGATTTTTKPATASMIFAAGDKS